MDLEAIQTREVILQSALMINENLVGHMSLYMTMLFAYIVMAYVAGGKLTRFQLVLTTFIFLAASCWEIMNISLLSMSTVTKVAQLAEFGGEVPDNPIGSNTATAVVIGALWSSGALAALLFMWSIRKERPKQ